MEGLDFIDDAVLRKTIDDAIEFAYTLSVESKKESEGVKKSALYQEETNRVIILYVVAVVEAILLHLYKRSGFVMTWTDYKFVHSVPELFRHSSSIGSTVVLAVQKIGKKEDFRIGMSDLIDFFEEHKLFKTGGMADDLGRINNLRNTFHLSKPREKVVCDTSQAEAAFATLVDVIKEAHHMIIAIALAKHNKQL